MSHFTVLVVTAEKPTEDVLHRVLLPFHEYECTGYTEYTQFVPADMTEAQADYEKYGEGRPMDVFMRDWGELDKECRGRLRPANQPE